MGLLRVPVNLKMMGGLSPNDHSGRNMDSYADDLEDQGTDCLHYKGKKYEDLQLEDLDGVGFKTIDEVEQFYAY